MVSGFWPIVLSSAFQVPVPTSLLAGLTFNWTARALPRLWRSEITPVPFGPLLATECLAALQGNGPGCRIISGGFSPVEGFITSHVRRPLFWPNHIGDSSLTVTLFGQVFVELLPGAYFLGQGYTSTVATRSRSAWIMVRTKKKTMKSIISQHPEQKPPEWRAEIILARSM